MTAKGRLEMFAPELQKQSGRLLLGRFSAFCKTEDSGGPRVDGGTAAADPAAPPHPAARFKPSAPAAAGPQPRSAAGSRPLGAAGPLPAAGRAGPGRAERPRAGSAGGRGARGGAAARCPLHWLRPRVSAAS